MTARGHIPNSNWRLRNLRGNRENLELVERIGLGPQTQTLNVLIERKDPKFHTRNFLPISLDYAPSNVEIARFDCTPEV